MPQARPPETGLPRPFLHSPMHSRAARPHRCAGAVGSCNSPCWLGPSTGWPSWARGQQLQAAQERQRPGSSRWVPPDRASAALPLIQSGSQGAVWIQILPAFPVRAASPTLSGARAHPAQGWTRPSSGAQTGPSSQPESVRSHETPVRCLPRCSVSRRRPQSSYRWIKPVHGSQTREQPDLPLLCTCFRHVSHGLCVLGKEVSAAGGGARCERDPASWSV